jgi:putative membrane protein
MSESLSPKDRSQHARASVPLAIERGGDPDEVSVELSSRRTGMSFQRTRMSADRTLMSVIRTSLSLITFGFTIFQFFRSLESQNLVEESHAARNFGLTLLYLGLGMIAVGILFHIRFMLGLRHERRSMAEEGLIHAESAFPGSYTLAIAILLLIVAVAALLSVGAGIGPFR